MDVKPRNEFAVLKFIVVAMGVALVAGTILLFVMLFQRQNAVKEEIVTPVSAASPVAVRCDGGQFTVPVRGEIQSFQQDSDRITLLTKERHNEQQVVVLDVCSGQIISSFALHKEKGYETATVEEVTPSAEEKPQETAAMQQYLLQEAKSLRKQQQAALYERRKAAVLNTITVRNAPKPQQMNE